MGRFNSPLANALLRHGSSDQFLTHGLLTLTYKTATKLITRKSMVRTLGITFTCLFLTACATGTGSRPGASAGFTPRTVVGTQCTATCGQEKASCKATATTCERTAASCMAGCQELDMLNRGR